MAWFRSYMLCCIVLYYTTVHYTTPYYTTLTCLHLIITSKKSLHAKVWYASFILFPVEGESEDIFVPEGALHPTTPPLLLLLPLEPPVFAACKLYLPCPPLLTLDVEVEMVSTLRGLAEAEASDICKPGPPSLTEFTCVCSLCAI